MNLPKDPCLEFEKIPGYKRKSFIKLLSYIFAACFFICLLFIVIYESVSSYNDFNEQQQDIINYYIDYNKDLTQTAVESVADIIEYQAEEIELEQKRELKERTQGAYQLINSIYNSYKGKLSDNEIQKISVHALKALRFSEGNSGYYFIGTFAGETVLNVVKPEYEGKKHKESKDKKYSNIFTELASIAQAQGEGFHKYDWINPETGKESAKLSYIKVFEPFSWYIGTGIYTDDSKEKSGQKLLKRVAGIKFGKKEDRYLFIYNSKNILISHPDILAVGDDLSKTKNEERKQFFIEQKALLSEKKSGFISYNYMKPTTQTIINKTTYIRKIDYWDWVVCSGIYADDVEHQIAKEKTVLKKKLEEDAFRIAIITVIMSIIAFILLKILFRFFKKDLDLLNEFLQKTAYSNDPLDITKIRYSEFKKQAACANKMLKDKIEAQRELVRQASIDPLTNISNRRNIMYMLEQEWGRAKRYGEFLSIVMFDLDFFKKVNDTYGHAAGDEVLIQIVNVCKNTLRTVDMVGRIGGEEFLLVLPNTVKQKAVIAAERVRKAIENNIIEYGDSHIKITISMGVASISSDLPESIDEFIKKADEYLYKAKNSGRNKVCSNEAEI